MGVEEFGTQKNITSFQDFPITFKKPIISC